MAIPNVVGGVEPMASQEDRHVTAVGATDEDSGGVAKQLEALDVEVTDGTLARRAQRNPSTT